MAKEIRVIGPPGTGKTTHLQRRIERAAETFGGRRVIAMSFTRAAAAELLARDLPVPTGNVGTVHGLAYRALGRPPLIEADRALLNQWHDSVPASWRITTQGSASQQGEAEVYLDEPAGGTLWSEYVRLRSSLTSRTTWSQAVRNLDERFRAFCKETNALDFTGLLEEAVQFHPKYPSAPAVVYVDEAQDLSKLQLRLVRQWGEAAVGFVTVGDTDQALYTWAGADPAALLSLDLPADQRVVLSQSYRVPRAVRDVALAWIRRMPGRRDVVYDPTEEQGTVRRLPYRVDQLPSKIIEDAEEQVERGRTVMILAACGYQLTDLLKSLTARGTPYGNLYRRRERRWNPLAPVPRGVSLAERMAWFCRGPQTWTAYTAGMIAEVLVGGVVRHGRKRVMVETAKREGSNEVPFDVALADWFAPEHVAAVGRGDPQWFARHVNEKSAARAFYMSRVVSHHGVDALVREPKLLAGTTHSVKGGEADVVYLSLGQSRAAATEWHAGKVESILRAMYVGMTRARHELVLCGADSLGVPSP